MGPPRRWFATTLFAAFSLVPMAGDSGSVARAIIPSARRAQARSQDSTSAQAIIVLPHKLVAGQSATLAVLAADGHLDPNTVVDFSGGGQVTTDVTGRAIFTAPDQPGVVLAALPGKDVSASATVVAARQTDGGPGVPAVRLTEVPREMALHDRFAVTGIGFHGEADGNRVHLGGRRALVLAASPVALVVLPDPQTTPGPVQLVVETRGAQASTQATLLAFEMFEAGAPNASASVSALPPGQARQLTVRVCGSGLPTELEAHNLTPNVVKLEGGGVQRITTSGGPENIATLKLKGLRAGNYSISLRLVPEASGLPDMETARQDLLAAQRVAPGHWRPRIEKLIEQLSGRPEDYLKVRDKLEKMLSERPPAELERWLEAAWRVLLNR